MLSFINSSTIFFIIFKVVIFLYLFKFQFMTTEKSSLFYNFFYINHSGNADHIRIFRTTLLRTTISSIVRSQLLRRCFTHAYRPTVGSCLVSIWPIFFYLCSTTLSAPGRHSQLSRLAFFQ